MGVAVFTAGYEGKSLESFVEELRNRGVQMLVDVRELPLSRKAGFSKTALAEGMAAGGIRYVHMRTLGTPRDMRRRLREEGDYEAFFADYRRHLDDNAEAVEELAAAAREQTVCLLCFEKDPRQCHRSVLTARLAEAGFQIIHL